MPMDSFQSILDGDLAPALRSELLKELQNLSDETDDLPPSLWITGIVRTRRIARGGEAEISIGSYNGKQVAIRDYFWSDDMGQDEIKAWRKIIRREILVHRQLRHKNVLRLIGVFRDDSHPMSIVVPYMENGSSKQFLENYPSEFLNIAIGCAAGLNYLHTQSPPVTHGDIHPSNILVSSSRIPVLCDFGLSRIRHEVTRTLTKTHEGGAARYMAPELFSGEGRFRATKASDCYSLAMTLFELSTKTRPFNTIIDSFEVWSRVRNEERPEYIIPSPSDNLSSEQHRLLSSNLTLMWAQAPEDRPTIVEFLRSLEQLRDLAPLKAPMNFVSSSDGGLAGAVSLLNLHPPSEDVVATAPEAISTVPNLPMSDANLALASPLSDVPTSPIVTTIFPTSASVVDLDSNTNGPDSRPVVAASASTLSVPSNPHATVNPFETIFSRRPAQKLVYSIVEFFELVRTNSVVAALGISFLARREEVQGDTRHQFVILTVGLPSTVNGGDRDGYVRLDRTLITDAITSPDNVVISGNEDRLVEPPSSSSIEAHVKFEPGAQPTLHSLVQVLEMIWSEYPDPALNLESSFFFCSILQQVFCDLLGGQLVFGRPDRVDDSVSDPIMERVEAGLDLSV